MMTTRRRGRVLEDAVLDAAWQLFREGGHAAVTMESVAARAHTNKSVLYRRWADRDEVLHAAITHSVQPLIRDVPDTGSLRGDLMAHLRVNNDALVDIVAVMSTHLAGWFATTGQQRVDFRQEVLATTGEAIEGIYQRAVDRGEVDPNRLTPRIKALPFDLARAEILVHLAPVPEEVMAEILDTIVLPLLRPQADSQPIDPTQTTTSPTPTHARHQGDRHE